MNENSRIASLLQKYGSYDDLFRLEKEMISMKQRFGEKSLYHIIKSPNSGLYHVFLKKFRK